MTCLIDILLRFDKDFTHLLRNIDLEKRLWYSKDKCRRLKSKEEKEWRQIMFRLKCGKKMVSFCTIIAIICSLFVGLSVNVLAADNIMIVHSTYGNFETAGIIVETVGAGESAAGVYAELWYREKGTVPYIQGHNFVKYDGNHLATSLFDLKNNTTYEYEVRRKVNAAGGVLGTLTGEIRTKPEFSLPRPTKIWNVNGYEEFLGAYSKNVKPGEEIRIAATANISVANIVISNLKGTVDKPITISSADTVKPLIKARLALVNCENVIINNLEVFPGDKGQQGIDIESSLNITVKDCYVHDAQDIYDGSAIRIRGSGKTSVRVYEGHLILNNIISDEEMESKNWFGPNGSARQTYFGINMRRYPGGFITIRGNTIYGFVDGMHPGAEEGQQPVLGTDARNLLDQYRGQNMDIYDNNIYNCRDDGMEMDGVGVNIRIFRNQIGNCSSSITLAPVYPGPYFIVRNTASGWHEQCLKQNTSVAGRTRGVLIYNNSFIMTDIPEDGITTPEGVSSTKCLYLGEPIYQQDFTYLNNIFYSRGRVIDADMGQSGYTRKDNFFDYNLDYSTMEIKQGGDYEDVLYKWNSRWRGDMDSTNFRYWSLEAFRAGTLAVDGVMQQEHGVYSDPFKTHTTPGTSPDAINKNKGYWVRYTKEEIKTNDNTIGNAPSKATDYRYDNKLYHITLPDDSPAKDMGKIIPGITDGYLGAAPDVGAVEIGSTPKSTPDIPLLSDESGVDVEKADKVNTTPKKPTKVKGVKVKNVKVSKKAKKGKVKITWKKLKKNVAGYQVFISTKSSKKGFKKKNFKKNKKASYIKTGLKKGKYVYVKLRAYNTLVIPSMGVNNTVYGKYTKVYKVKVKK